MGFKSPFPIREQNTRVSFGVITAGGFSRVGDGFCASLFRNAPVVFWFVMFYLIELFAIPLTHITEVHDILACSINERADIIYDEKSTKNN